MKVAWDEIVQLSEWTDTNRTQVEPLQVIGIKDSHKTVVLAADTYVEGLDIRWNADELKP